MQRGSRNKTLVSKPWQFQGVGFFIPKLIAKAEKDEDISFSWVNPSYGRYPSLPTSPKPRIAEWTLKFNCFGPVSFLILIGLV